MRSLAFKFVLSLLIIMMMTTSQIFAGEVFRYMFEKKGALSYEILIKSDLTFPELGNLAQLLNIDKINNEVGMDVDLIVESLEADGDAVIRALFRRISSVSVARDSVWVDKRSDWGRIRAGSNYQLVVSPRGEIKISDFTDSLESKQVIQTIQRFFPIFPESSIELNYSWSDSVNYELELPNQSSEEITSAINYTYSGRIGESDLPQFSYKAAGRSLNTNSIILNGNGIVEFDDDQGILVSNNGDFIITAETSLASFGLPAALGTTLVHIDSKISINFKENEK